MPPLHFPLIIADPRYLNGFIMLKCATSGCGFSFQVHGCFLLQVSVESQALIRSWILSFGLSLLTLLLFLQVSINPQDLTRTWILVPSPHFLSPLKSTLFLRFPLKHETQQQLGTFVPSPHFLPPLESYLLLKVPFKTQDPTRTQNLSSKSSFPSNP